MSDVNGQQVAIDRREYADQSEVECRGYQLTFAQEVLARIGVRPPQEADVTSIGLDDVDMVRFVDEVGRRTVCVYQRLSVSH